MHGPEYTGFRTQSLRWGAPKDHSTRVPSGLPLGMSVHYFSKEEAFPSFYPFFLSLCLFSTFFFNFLVLKMIKAKILNPKACHENSPVWFLVIPVILWLCGLKLQIAFISCSLIGWKTCLKAYLGIPFCFLRNNTQAACQQRGKLF